MLAGSATELYRHRPSSARIKAGILLGLAAWLYSRGGLAFGQVLPSPEVPIFLTAAGVFLLLLPEIRLTLDPLRHELAFSRAYLGFVRRSRAKVEEVFAIKVARQGGKFTTAAIDIELRDGRCLRLSGFTGREEAESKAGELRRRLGIDEASQWADFDLNGANWKRWAPPGEGQLQLWYSDRPPLAHGFVLLLQKTGAPLPDMGSLLGGLAMKLMRRGQRIFLQRFHIPQEAVPGMDRAVFATGIDADLESHFAIVTADEAGARRLLAAPAPLAAWAAEHPLGTDGNDYRFLLFSPDGIRLGCAGSLDDDGLRQLAAAVKYAFPGRASRRFG